MGAGVTHYEQQEKVNETAEECIVRAHDSALDRPVALRKIPEPLRTDAAALEKFMDQARVVGRLQHPNIPQTYSLEEDVDGAPVLCSQWVDGETLEAILDRLREGDKATHRQFSWARRLQIIQRICAALQFAHGKGYLHGDLWTSDVVLGPYGEVLTRRWSQARPMTDGPGADIQSLGKLMYVLFTLSTPAAAPKAPESVKTPHQGRVPREISRLILRVLTGGLPTAVRIQEEIQVILDGDSRPVCPHTTVKYGFNVMGRLLDEHNLWLAPLVLIWLAWPLKDILAFVWSKFLP